MAVDLRRVVILAAGVALSVLSGCTSASQTASSKYPAAAGPDRSDDYPDITALVSSASAQMSDEEAARMSANLQALSASRASGAISEAEYRRRVAEMQALAGGHGAAALSDIEN